MSGKFSISGAVGNAYTFIGREWRYLLRFSLFPLGLNLLTNVFVFSQQETMSLPLSIIWNLPASAAAAWFVFIEVRLLLLGERLTNLPDDPAYLNDRRRSMTLCVIMFLLIYMLGMGIMKFHAWSQIQGPEAMTSLSLLALFLLGVGLWAMRFAPAPILAAVGQPVAPYIRKVNGAGISFRLLGLLVLSILPLSICTAVLAQLLLPNLTVEQLQRGVPLELVLLDAPFAVACWAVTGAACSYALKEILGEKNGRKDVKP